MRSYFSIYFFLFFFLFGTTSSYAIVIQPTGLGKISGRVFLDDHPEIGLSNIEVVALDIGYIDQWCIWFTTTDANGYYSIEDLPEDDRFILYTYTNPEVVTEGYFDELYDKVTSFSGSDVPWSSEAAQLEDILLNKISSNNLSDPNILVTIVSLKPNNQAIINFGLSTHRYSLSKGFNLFAYPGKPISAYNTAFKLLGNETISPTLTSPNDAPAIHRMISPALSPGGDRIDWEMAYWDTLNQTPAGTDFKIEMNRGYVLYSSVDLKDLIMPPIIISSSPIDLAQGINLISIPDVYDKQWSAHKTLSHLNTSPDTGRVEEKAACLSHFEAKQGKWKSVTSLWGESAGDDFRIERAQGYLIHMKEPKQWSRVEEDITKAPSVTILSPLDNFTCNQGVDLQFTGSALDYEDGTLAGEVLVWVSSIDGQIGQGTSFTKNDLSVGLHTITMTATDSHGNIGNDQITMTILEPSWAKKIGNNGDEIANSIQQTIDGGYIVAGYNGDFNGYVAKLDSNGNLIWTKLYGEENYCLINCIEQTSDGGFIMAGYHLGFGDFYSDFYVAKLDSNGNLSPSWPKIFDGGFGRDDELRSIKQTLDGGYIMTGYTTRQDDTTDIYVIKFDANGNIDSPWPKVFDGGDHGDDGGHSIQPTSDGGYILAGYTTLPDDTTNIYVAKLNANGTMATSWPKKFDGGDQDSDEAYSIQQTQDGGYILAGYTTLSDYTSDIYVAKLEANGTMAASWPKKIDGGSQDYDLAYSIQQTTDGGYILAGYTTNSEFWNRDFFMVKLTDSGSVDWKKIIGETNYDDEAKSIQQTLEGGYIAAGYTTNSNNTIDVYVVKLDSGGN